MPTHGDSPASLPRSDTFLRIRVRIRIRVRTHGDRAFKLCLDLCVSVSVCVTRVRVYVSVKPVSICQKDVRKAMSPCVPMRVRIRTPVHMRKPNECGVSAFDPNGVRILLLVLGEQI